MARLLKRVPLDSIWEGFLPVEGQKKYDPPDGEGYQLWETATEGRPISPVFKELDVLCIWCESNAIAFAGITLTSSQWKKLFETGYVSVKVNNEWSLGLSVLRE